MISVQNRLPEPGKENRVSITPDNGSAVEGVLAYADDATQEGTFWNRKTAQLLQGDIRTYPVREGQSISAGDVVNVGRELLSGTEQTYGDLPVGSTVQINENGSPVDYLVVHQGKPSDMYDDSCDGTWMLRKDIAEKRAWDSGDSTVLESSDIQAYLNGDWMNRYDSDTMGKIKTVKIPYRQNGGYNGTDRNGANGLSCRIFLLSGREVGWDSSDNSYFPNDGAKLGYFIDGTTSSANNKRIANLNGSATDWWLRSPSTGRTNYVWYVNSDGDDNGGIASYSWGVRPAFIVDSSALTGDKPVYGPETVYKDVVAQDNVENTIETYSIVGQAAFLLKENTPIVLSQYYATMSTRTYVKVLSTDGSAVIAEESFTGSGNVSVGKISDTRFIVQTSQNSTALQGIILTYENGSISKGSNKTILDTGGKTNNSCIVVISENIAFSIYNSSGIKMKRLSFSSSSNAITVSSSATSLSGNTGANYISACKLPDDTNGNKRVCICFSDTGDGNKGKAVIATIDSSNAVTFGTVKTIENSAVTATACATDGNSIVFNTSDSLILTDLSLNTLDTETSTAGDVTNVSAYTYAFLGTNNNAMVIKTNGGTISNGEAYAINSGSNTNYPSLAATSERRVIAAYSDAGNSNYGTTTILEISGNQIAGSFIDNSSDAIALADGTGGQEIPVGFGGYCECPGVTEGETIDSSGVSAYAVQDGWLDINPQYRKQYVVGGYTGNGVANRIISIGFTPSAVLVYDLGEGFEASNYTVGGLATLEYPITEGGFNSPNIIAITENGFIAGGQNGNATINRYGDKYSYIAWR